MFGCVYVCINITVFTASEFLIKRNEMLCVSVLSSSKRPPLQFGVLIADDPPTGALFSFKETAIVFF